jgi:hypothetical protein
MNALRLRKIIWEEKLGSEGMPPQVLDLDLTGQVSHRPWDGEVC